MTYLIVSFIAGMLLSAVAFSWRIMQLKKRLAATIMTLQTLQLSNAEAETASASLPAEAETIEMAEVPQPEVAEAEEDITAQPVHQEVTDTYQAVVTHDVAEDQYSATEFADSVKRMTDDIVKYCNQSSESIHHLLSLAKTFDRWNVNMSKLTDHNKVMRHQNDEFTRIVNQIIIVALNASIEAARAGSLGGGSLWWQQR